MDAPVFDQAELGILGHCVEDYCGSTELWWALHRLTPGLTNRAVLVRPVTMRQILDQLHEFIPSEIESESDEE